MYEYSLHVCVCVCACERFILTSSDVTGRHMPVETARSLKCYNFLVCRPYNLRSFLDSLLLFYFQVRLNSHKKRLLTSSCLFLCFCPFFRLSSCIRAAPTGRISVKFGITNFYKISAEKNPYLFKIEPDVFM